MKWVGIMRSQVQFLVEAKTLGDFFLSVLALVDRVVWYVLLGGDRYSVELVEPNGSGLTASDLNVGATVHYGIPSTASILAVDPVQRLLAIGTFIGSLNPDRSSFYKHFVTPYFSDKDFDSGNLDPGFLNRLKSLKAIVFRIDNVRPTFMVYDEMIGKGIQYTFFFLKGSFTLVRPSPLLRLGVSLFVKANSQLFSFAILDSIGQTEKFLQNQGFLVSITNENGIQHSEMTLRELGHGSTLPKQVNDRSIALGCIPLESKNSLNGKWRPHCKPLLPLPPKDGRRPRIKVWNLKSRSVACDLQWESNITAFSVINGSSFMYVGDEYGTISVLKFCDENNELLQLPYQILWSSLSGLCLLIPYSGVALFASGLVILWDVVEAHVIIVKEEKEIATLCWASTDGSILAAGYIDGDILLWKISKLTASKGQEAGPFDNVVKLQLSSAEKRPTVIVLHWWANSKSRNNSVISSFMAILTLEWSSGMETLRCVDCVDLTLSGSFADTILLPNTGATATDENTALFVLMSPGQLNFFDCSTLSDLVSKEEKKVFLSAKDFPVELPIVDPSMTVTKLTQLHSDGNLEELLQEVKGVNKVISSASVSKIDFCFQTLRLAVGDECGLVRLYDFKHRDLENFHFIADTKSEATTCLTQMTNKAVPDNGSVLLVELDYDDTQPLTTSMAPVHGLAQGQGPTCRAVLKILDVRVRAIEFVNHGAKLAIGYENAKVAVIDMTSLSVLFLSDTVSAGGFPLVTLIAKRVVHSDGRSKSPKQPELPENHMEELMFILTEDAKIYVIDGCNENDIPYSGITRKLPDSSKDDADSNEPSQEMTTRHLGDTVPFLENDPSKKHSESFILLCCKDAIHTYATKYVGDIKSVCKVKLDKPCCWTTAFMKEGKVCGLLLLFQNGDIEIRSLPDLELVERTSLVSALRWNFKPNMDRAMSSRENGHITLANGSELASVSLLASENDFRIPESLPSLHDEVLEAAADAAMKFSTQKKKQGGGPNIDDIEIDEPVPVASTSSHNTQNSKRVTEREKFLDSEGDDAKPRLRTREEIIAKYRKAGDESSAAGQARDKLLERQEKLERINQRTEELRSGAEDFASLANELVKMVQKKKSISPAHVTPGTGITMHRFTINYCFQI
ncbi:hypothetical protein RND71_038551 [Anisodus tanguticus]|uniref:V-SNARE coiled-coil homology domain-containing protein n=1 Tax=Anisodus tanguticus TaxID=243964 RepID=A0AAE1QZY0_9SOLA|nr:hypothetical protein RND71_038551 [Anisodus tanguticus]